MPQLRVCEHPPAHTPYSLLPRPSLNVSYSPAHQRRQKRVQRLPPLLPQRKRPAEGQPTGKATLRQDGLDACDQRRACVCTSRDDPARFVAGPNGRANF